MSLPVRRRRVGGEVGVGGDDAAPVIHQRVGLLDEDLARPAEPPLLLGPELRHLALKSFGTSPQTP